MTITILIIYLLLSCAILIGSLIAALDEVQKRKCVDKTGAEIIGECFILSVFWPILIIMFLMYVIVYPIVYPFIKYAKCYDEAREKQKNLLKSAVESFEHETTDFDKYCWSKDTYEFIKDLEKRNKRKRKKNDKNR